MPPIYNVDVFAADFNLTVIDNVGFLIIVMNCTTTDSIIDLHFFFLS